MQPLPANANDLPLSEKVNAGASRLSIKAVALYAGLTFMILLFFSSGGTFNLVVAGILTVCLVLNVLLDKPENLTRNNASLIVVALIVAFLVSFFDALNLTRPLTHTDDFFKTAGADFHRESLGYSETGAAVFRIALTTAEFEKLADYYREDAHKRLEEGGYYGWGYCELDPSSIRRNNFVDTSHELLASRLQAMQTTQSAVMESHRLKDSIEEVMEGFPEFGEELGRCRVIVWDSPEVAREFYWFEKQQKGYINP